VTDVLGHVDATQIIVAALATFATLMGVRQMRAGQRDTAVQQIAANKLQADQLQLEAFKALIPSLEAEADRAYRLRDEARGEADTERGRRIECETAVRLAEEQTRRALSDLAALRMIVLDEVARAASDDAWGPPEPAV
jgi:hypothetical protein